ncbi:hypothetical protein ABGB07_03990 [Micromonosporaceae bacterium B7E4]
MSGWINRALGAGRRLQDVEKQLDQMSASDPRRAALSREAARLQREKTGHLAKALGGGVSEQTIRTALELHGQGPGGRPSGPTPAEQIGDLMRRHGVERVVDALGQIRRETR